MRGMWVIYRKELADHFSSNRFVILFALITMVSLITTFMVGTSLKKELEGIARPSLVFMMLFTSTGDLFSLAQFIAFFGPLIGLVLGFDAINRERINGTLSKLAAQPIYRDAIINGKFMAGVVTIKIMLLSIVLLISGLGLFTLGVTPGPEEVGRVLIYLVISIFYISFWLGVAILFSIFFRNIATSALAAIALWIFFSFFVTFGASLAANALVPIDQNQGADAERLFAHAQVQKAVSLLSPMKLYSDATSTILDPMRKTTRSLILIGPMERVSMDRFNRPLPLGQSILVVFPYIVFLILITLICFAISYLAFMRQEIRSG
ncbi:MAG: ABC transporter permease [Deltaproteobacteria bacterium]|nr:ABC transporter permease [Deltaproteobacteria bacterium]